MEGVNVLEARESIENGLEFFAEGLGSELDFSSIEACNTLSAHAN